MSLSTVRGLGLEEIARGAFIQLFNNLNDKLAQIETTKLTEDEELDDLRGNIFIPVELEPVPNNSFYLGHNPSLIIDPTTSYVPPLEWFPSVSVMNYRSQPSSGSGLFDHVEVHNNSLYVEVIVKAGPDNMTGKIAEVCDKRIWRTLDAVHNTLIDDPTLGGLIEDLQNPVAVISEVFTRPASDLNPEIDWFWQAGRIDYTVLKTSPYDYD